MSDQVHRFFLRLPHLQALGRGEEVSLNGVDGDTYHISAIVPPSQKAGILEVGVNEEGEVIVNHPSMMTDENGCGWIAFTPQQAEQFARTLLRNALKAILLRGGIKDPDSFIREDEPTFFDGLIKTHPVDSAAGGSIDGTEEASGFQGSGEQNCEKGRSVREGSRSDARKQNAESQSCGEEGESSPEASKGEKVLEEGASDTAR